MGFKDWFGFGGKSNNDSHYVPDKVDQAARVIATPGPDGVKRRYDGSSYDQPYQHAGGYDGRRKDFLPKFFGSEVRKQADGNYCGIAGAEMVKGADGLWHRKDDTRSQRGGKSEALGYDRPARDDDGWLR
jgi:hypothetical protein